jgi:hypothetical protein
MERHLWHAASAPGTLIYSRLHIAYLTAKVSGIAPGLIADPIYWSRLLSRRRSGMARPNMEHWCDC